MFRNRFSKSRIFVSVLFAVCLLVPVFACKQKSPEPGPNEVWLIGWTYIPDTLTVTVGTTVTWKNTTLDFHTVTSDTGLFDAPLDQGASYKFTFTAPGTYGYHDTSTDPHTVGQIIVK